MYSSRLPQSPRSRQKYILCLVFITAFLLSILGSGVSQADDTTVDHSGDVTLYLKPKDCVVLKQGATCHTTVEISWAAATVDDYCIFSSQQDFDAKCWNRQKAGQLKTDISVSENTQFYLVLKSTDVILKEVTLVVGWVYEKSNRPIQSWRLF